VGQTLRPVCAPLRLDRQAQGDNSKDRYKVKSIVTLRFSKCEVGQTLRLVFISLRPIRQLADQGDNSKDRYKLTVFLKVILRPLVRKIK